MRRKPGDLVPFERGILAILRQGPMHAYGMACLTDTRARISSGAYSKALRRLEQMGLVRGEWQAPLGPVRRRVYSLTEVAANA